MLQRMGIRGKMLLTIAVPLFILVMTGAVIVAQAVGQLSAANNTQSVVAALTEAREFQSDLTDERYLAVNFLDSVQLGRAAYVDAQEDTDTAYETLQSYLATVEDAEDPDEAEAAERLSSQLTALMTADASGEVLQELRTERITAGEAGLEFPEQQQATQARIDYATIASAVERLQESSAAASTGSAVYLGGLANRLNAEGLALLQVLTEPVEIRTELLAVYDETLVSIESLTSAAQQIGSSAANDPVRERIDAGAALLEDLASVRANTLSATANSSTTRNFYTQMIDLSNQSIQAATATATDSDLTSRLAATARLTALTESLEFEKIVDERLIRAGEFGAQDPAFVREQAVRSDLLLDEAQESAQAVPTLDAVPEFRSVAAGANSTYTAVRTSLLNGLDSSLVAAKSTNWPTLVDNEVTQFTPLIDQAWDEVVAISNQNVQALVTQTILVTLLVVAAIAIAFIVASTIARQITVPLRRLTTTATAVRQELPRLVERVAMPGESVDLSEVQIPVESSDEVGRLAEAFNGVNAATLSIAAEQAALRGSISEMFVNVARRDQVLLNRQLASIDEMERTEDNPETLTKLFALDHLATRMRRNSESLLVLAGIDTGRRLRRPMPLSDVVRTASSEIELYERVQLELDADPSMVGHSSLTAAHLFAELLENATVFSDPGSPVIVRTGERDGAYIVEVVDTGIGMNPEELHEANSRVASNQASEILGAQRLGLFVVGRIARRIGARVEINSHEGEGTTAIVTLPPSLFDERDQAPAGQVQRSAQTVADEIIDNPITGPAEAAGQARPDVAAAAAGTAAASLEAYTPAKIEEGTSLSGRAEGESDDSIPAPQVPAGDVESLIAADAASAPAGAATDSTALVAGATSTGLPTRRRRADDATQAPAERTPVIPLPAQATAEQLSALEGESAGGGFTPTVSASEVAPQSAEQRAAMFRGFRPRRAGEEPAGVPSEQPAATALPSRRRPSDAAAAFGAPTETPESAPLPTLEPDDAAPAVEPSAPDAAPAAGAPEVQAEPAPSTGQSPLIQHGFGHDDFATPSAGAAGGAGSMAFEIPSFEDDEPAPASEAPAAQSEQPGAFAVPALEDDSQAGVQSVSLEDYPSGAYGDQPATTAPHEQVPHPSEQPQAPQLFQQWGQRAPQPEQPQSPQQWGQPAPQPEQPQSPQQWGQPAPQPEQPQSPQQWGQPAPQPEQPQSPQQWGQPAPQPEQPQAAQPSQPAPSLDDLISSAVSEDEDARGGFFNRLFGRKGEAAAAGTAASAASASPRAQQAPFAAPESVAPAQPSQPAQPVQPPASGPAPVAPGPITPGGGFMPEASQDDNWAADVAAVQSAQAAAQPAPTSFAPDQSSFTPDQLANPVGWEAAGASALQAAEPESARSYRPVVQIDPEPVEEGSGAPDMSDVFSEFSSLTAERPKVEKTRAGLAKRQKAPAAERPAPEPLETEVSIPAAPRDAEAVRSRFSNFYSGTQRARSDVAAFEQQSDPAVSE